MSSLDNGFRILALLSADRPVLRVTEVAKELGLPKATVSRTLATLDEAHMVERRSDGAGYTVGMGTLDLAQLYLSRFGILDLVSKALNELVERYGFTGHAGKLAGTDRILLIAKQGWYPLQHTAKMASRSFAFDSIIGQAILARQSDNEVLELLGLTEPGAGTHGYDRDYVKRSLRGIRKDGIAVSESLITPGIASIGTAVADASRDEIIGFCLSLPVSAADENKRRHIREDVLAHAKEIGRKLRDPFWIE